MDWSALLRDAWRITRRTPALWGLGTISALQAAMYALLIIGLIAPVSVLTQLLVVAGSAPSASGGGATAALQSLLPQVVSWIRQWEPVLVAGMIATFTLWVVTGALDVAATAGTISQTSRVAEGDNASLRAGMRDGFGVWWRAVGLLAVAALPALAYLLVFAVFTLLAIVIPVLSGIEPDPNTIHTGGAINGLLSIVVALLGVPLGVLVQFGMRYLVVERQEWASALRSAWRLAREDISDVVLMYLLQLGISLAASFVVSMAFVVLFALAGVTVAVIVATAHALSVGAMFVTLIALLVATAVGLASGAAMLVWTSVLWTLFWRRLTGREPRRATPPVYRSLATSSGGHEETL